MPREVTNIKDEALRRARALMIIKGRIHSQSNKSLAKEFNVSEATIATEIDWAKRKGLVASFEDQVLESLVPEAINVFKNALANNDTQAALEVLKGTGILRKPSDKSSYVQPVQEEESLEIHIKRISVPGLSGPSRQSPALSSGGATAFDPTGFLEGAVIGPPALAERVGPGSSEGGTQDAQISVAQPFGPGQPESSEDGD